MGSGYCNFCQMWHSAGCGHPSNPANRPRPAILSAPPSDEPQPVAPPAGDYAELVAKARHAANLNWVVGPALVTQLADAVEGLRARITEIEAKLAEKQKDGPSGPS